MTERNKKMENVSVKEIGRFRKKAEDSVREIEKLKEEISALHQLLDCAAANIVLLVNGHGGKCKIPADEISRVLGKYELSASRESDGTYLVETREKK